jgi:hypothetical protein
VKLGSGRCHVFFVSIHSQRTGRFKGAVVWKEVVESRQQQNHKQYMEHGGQAEQYQLSEWSDIRGDSADGRDFRVGRQTCRSIGRQ